MMEKVVEEAARQHLWWLIVVVEIGNRVVVAAARSFVSILQQFVVLGQLNRAAVGFLKDSHFQKHRGEKLLLEDKHPLEWSQQGSRLELVVDPWVYNHWQLVGHILDLLD
jgi:hypothetical protein